MTTPGETKIHISNLAELGWGPHFESQLDAGMAHSAPICRVMAVHRSGLDVLGLALDTMIPQLAKSAAPGARSATVGDWLVLDPQTLRPKLLLQPRSLLKRRSAGTGRGIQLIGANIDTLFIVTSCNQDFNVARLERYLALAGEAGVTPVLVITKADLTPDADEYRAAAEKLLEGVQVVVLDARSWPDVARHLSPWCGWGQTIALLGSSGVGKSTLVNALKGTDGIATQAIRENDAKGRHTTTARELHQMPGGAWLMDTPGMRELQLVDVEDGVREIFDDISSLALSCRFRNCRHESEPGCAVLAAIARGELDQARFQRWNKLLAEERFNSQSLHERRAKDKAFGKMVRSVKDQLDEP